MRVLLVCACAALAIACGSADDVDAGAAGAAPRAAEFRSARVDSMLESVSRVVRTRGFATEGEAWRGFLLEQGTELSPAPLRTGSCYVVAAVGSSALRELDLRIFDGDGAEVARDGEQGSIAVARFCPAQNGTYYVASRAAAGSGLYSTRVFRGPTGLSLRVEDVLRAVAPAPPGPREPG